MKRDYISKLALSLCLTVSMSTLNVFAETRLKGDITENSKVNVFDFQMMKSGLANLENDPEGIGRIADFTGDMLLDGSDIKAMKQYILNDIVESDEPENTFSYEDIPQEYIEPLDWIWENRIVREQSTVRRNTIFDQIVDGKGTLNYVVRWQSYKTITLEQRQRLETMLESSVNRWTDALVGYDGWEYEHIDVKIVGWAVLDKNCLLDLQPDEVVYDNLISDYDSSADTSNGIEEIPDKLPSAPDEMSRMWHFDNNTGFNYPNGLESRFDMYLWATQGFPSIGGCGGDWGQRLSDDAYMNMADSGAGVHVLDHEIGHGFGITDFYGGEGEIDGYPVGGFPGNGTSIMMAGSSAEITDFDKWMLRRIWTETKELIMN